MLLTYFSLGVSHRFMWVRGWKKGQSQPRRNKGRASSSCNCALQRKNRGRKNKITKSLRPHVRQTGPPRNFGEILSKVKLKMGLSWRRCSVGKIHQELLERVGNKLITTRYKMCYVHCRFSAIGLNLTGFKRPFAINKRLLLNLAQAKRLTTICFCSTF